jgi:hypothetical protein
MAERKGRKHLRGAIQRSAAHKFAPPLERKEPAAGRPASLSLSLSHFPTPIRISYRARQLSSFDGQLSTFQSPPRAYPCASITRCQRGGAVLSVNIYMESAFKYLESRFPFQTDKKRQLLVEKNSLSE